MTKGIFTKEEGQMRVVAPASKSGVERQGKEIEGEMKKIRKSSKFVENIDAQFLCLRRQEPYGVSCLRAP